MKENLFKRIPRLPITGLLLIGVLVGLGPTLFSDFTSDPCPIRGTTKPGVFPQRAFYQDIGKAFAVAQWARKFKVDCTECHTVFPRLNYAGEKFKRAGFQFPAEDGGGKSRTKMFGDLDDGGTPKKKVFGDLDIGDVKEWFGARIDFEPVRYETNGLTEDGNKKSLVTVGRPLWLQFFTAGTITKDISIFNRLELNTNIGAASAALTVRNSLFYMGFNNLIGPDGLVNFRAGLLAPKDWTSFSNRCRIFPEVTAITDKTKSSVQATATREEGIASADSNVGADYYGYSGPLIWALGVSNPNYSNTNRFLNYWGSIRAEINSEESALEGSSASFFYYTGKDTATASTAQKVNDFFRWEPAVNLRYRGWDVIVSYQYGKDNNTKLVATNPVINTYKGFTGIVAYKMNRWFMPGLGYENLNFSDALGNRTRYIARAAFLARKNFQFILASELEGAKGSETGTINNKYYATIETMF